MINQKAHIYLLIAVAIPGSLLYFFSNPEHSIYFPPCPLHHFTGWYCPGCGSQRALHDLLHGNIGASADHNLLFVAALPLVGYSAVITTINVFGRNKKQQPVFNSGKFAWLVFAVVITFFILRNIPVYPFLWLAP